MISGRIRQVLTVSPGRPLRGEMGPHGAARLPGDKSLSHRAALLAALAEGESRIENFLTAGVTRAMLDGLTALGVPWELHERTLRVTGRGLHWESGAPAQIHCGNSATTLRLFAGALAALGIPAVLDGSAGLRRRPMRRIVEPLRQMDVAVEAVDGCAPLVLSGPLISSGPHSLRAIDHTLAVASAQVKSCLLLAALAAQGETVLREPGPSRDHTERMLRALGVPLDSRQEAGQYVTRIAPCQPVRLPPLRLALPGDMSAAAFLIVAALITPGSEIVLRSVGLNPTRTGLLEALQDMGADIQVTLHPTLAGGEPLGDLHVRHSRLHGVQVSGDRVVRMIDEFPAFAVAAAFARGETLVRQAEELRHKESDRISDLSQELRKLGASVQETPDGFCIQGGSRLNTPPHGEPVLPHDDHRLAMALALVGLAAEAPVSVQGAEIISESFPDFVQVLQTLGGDLALAETFAPGKALESDVDA